MWELYLVTDRDLSLGRPLEDVVLEAVRGGVSIVQLREKQASTRLFLDEAERRGDGVGRSGGAINALGRPTGGGDGHDLGSVPPNDGWFGRL